MLDVSLIVSLGPTSRGVEKQWDISTDPLKSCKAPLLFVAGSKSAVCSIPYMEVCTSVCNVWDICTYICIYMYDIVNEIILYRM